MHYDKIVKGKFIERPNRFIAYVDIDGKIEKCHVKNTGRCKELLIPGVTVYLEEPSNPNRKTKYSLVGLKSCLKSAFVNLFLFIHCLNSNFNTALTYSATTSEFIQIVALRDIISFNKEL